MSDADLGGEQHSPMHESVIDVIREQWGIDAGRLMSAHITLGREGGGMILRAEVGLSPKPSRDIENLFHAAGIVPEDVVSADVTADHYHVHVMAEVRLRDANGDLVAGETREVQRSFDRYGDLALAGDGA